MVHRQRGTHEGLSRDSTRCRDTVDSIATGIFGNDFKGSSLEVVLTAITEQKQVFEGAAHPFYWKLKLRIPDIYENEVNKQKFGAFLEAVFAATREEQILTEISRWSPAFAHLLETAEWQSVWMTF